MNEIDSAFRAGDLKQVYPDLPRLADSLSIGLRGWLYRRESGVYPSTAVTTLSAKVNGPRLGGPCNSTPGCHADFFFAFFLASGAGGAASGAATGAATTGGAAAAASFSDFSMFKRASSQFDTIL